MIASGNQAKLKWIKAAMSLHSVDRQIGTGQAPDHSGPPREGYRCLTGPTQGIGGAGRRLPVPRLPEGGALV